MREVEHDGVFTRMYGSDEGVWEYDVFLMVMQPRPVFGSPTSLSLGATMSVSLRHTWVCLAWVPSVLVRVEGGPDYRGRSISAGRRPGPGGRFVTVATVNDFSLRNP